MPFGRKARCVKAYEFGCRVPIDGETVAVEQMRGRLKLWNQLVELDHCYDVKRETVLSSHISIDGSYEYFSNEKKVIKEQGDIEKLDELLKQEKEWKQQRKAAFKIEAVKEQFQVLDKEEYEEARKLWLESNLYWVNHEEVKLVWQQARKKPGQLRFHSWHTENGKLSVRWQNGLSVADAFSGASTLLKLAPVSDMAYLSPIRSERRKLSRSQVSIRVASDNRKPVWLTIPCILHRQLPSDGVIRSASIIRERLGIHYRWKLILIVETAETQNQIHGSGTIALKVSWRKRPDGLRVCYWQDDHGNNSEFILPAEWLNSKQKVDDLKAIRKMHFNNIIDALGTWLNNHEHPQWLTEITTHIGKWRSEERLHFLYTKLQEQRFEGDGELYQNLEAWHKRDRHLGEYQVNLDDKLYRRRREEYRKFAASLTSRYANIVTEDVNFAQLARRKKSDNEVVIDEIGHQRTLVAPSSLIQAINNASRRDGASFTKLKLPPYSHVCPSCGTPEQSKQVVELDQKCVICGSLYDRDRARVVKLLSEVI